MARQREEERHTFERDVGVEFLRTSPPHVIRVGKHHLSVQSVSQSFEGRDETFSCDGLSRRPKNAARNG